jgi:hypothetical protein
VLTAHFHAHQRGGQLLRLHFAAHHGGEQLVALLLAQGFGLYSFSRIGWRVLVCSSFCSAQARFAPAGGRPGGQDRFRVELEAADAIRIVTHRHHHTVEIGVDGQPGGILLPTSEW